MAEVPDLMIDTLINTAAGVKDARENAEAAGNRLSIAVAAHRAALLALDKHVAGLVRRDPAES